LMGRVATPVKSCASVHSVLLTACCTTLRIVAVAGKGIPWAVNFVMHQQHLDVIDMSRHLDVADCREKKNYPPNQLQLYILVQLHVFGVDAQHLQAANLIWDSYVDLTIKPPKSPQCSVNAAENTESHSLFSPPSIQQLLQHGVPLNYFIGGLENCPGDMQSRDPCSIKVDCSTSASIASFDNTVIAKQYCSDAD